MRILAGRLVCGGDRALVFKVQLLDDCLEVVLQALEPHHVIEMLVADHGPIGVGQYVEAQEEFFERRFCGRDVALLHAPEQRTPAAFDRAFFRASSVSPYVFYRAYASGIWSLPDPLDF